VNLGTLKAVILTINIYYLTAIIGLSLLVFLTAAIRSLTFIRGMGVKSINLIDAYKYYLVAAFYNQFLPTTMGGDVVRIYMIQKKSADVFQASSSVVTERLIGLVTIIFISFIATFLIPYNPDLIIFRHMLMVLLLLAAGFIIIIFLPAALTFFNRVFMTIGFKKVNHFVQQFITALHDYREKPGLLIWGFVLTMVYDLGDITVVYLLGLLIGIEIAFCYYLLFIPLVHIVSIIPISLNGVGLRENTMVYLFGLVGVSSSLAFLLSILIYLDRLIKAIIGALWITAENGKLTIIKGDKNA